MSFSSHVYKAIFTFSLNVNVSNFNKPTFWFKGLLRAGAKENVDEKE